MAGQKYVAPYCCCCQAKLKNKIAFQSKADHPRTTYTDTILCFCDLDLDLMTLMYELDLEILKMYLHTKNKLSMSKLSTVKALETDRQTRVDTQTYRHMRPKNLPRCIRRW